MSDVTVRVGGQTINVALGGAQGPRGFNGPDLVELGANTGATLIGTSTGDTVEEALAARPKNTDLSALDGDTRIGSNDGRDSLVFDDVSGAQREQAGKVSPLRRFWARVVAEQKDVRLLVLGDSTGNDQTEWVYLLAQWLVGIVPTHSVKYGLYDAATGWPALSTVAAGSGARSIEIWNASIAGSTGEDFQGGKLAAVWGGRDFDAVVINFGHNYGTLSVEKDMRLRFGGLLGEALLLAPDADFLVTLQNPRTGTDGPKQTASAVAAWRSVASNFGVGVIDVYSLFKLHSDPASLMADTTHPNDAGQLLWSKAVIDEFRKPLTLGGGVQAYRQPLSTAGVNYLRNPRFSDWTGSAPKGWTVENATVVKSPGLADGSLYSLKATAGASGTPSMSQTLAGAALEPLKGKTVTVVARVYKPAGLDPLAGRVGVVSNNGTASVLYTSYARGEKSVGGWTYEIAQVAVQLDATSLEITSYFGGAAGIDNGKSIYVDSVGLFVGHLPMALGRGDEKDKLLTSWYAPEEVKKHPTQGGGTLTVTGNSITVVGSTAALNGVVINLPPLVAGETYELQYDPVSITGATSGFVYVRNGPDGGSSNITTGSWLPADGPKTLSFTGVYTPVSIWFGSGGASTGWQIDAIDIVQL